jgi:hypothetical protein
VCLSFKFHYWKLLIKNIFILHTHPTPSLGTEMHKPGYACSPLSGS